MYVSNNLFCFDFSKNEWLTLAYVIKTITQYFLPAVLTEIKLALDGDFANSLGAWSSVNESSISLRISFGLFGVILFFFIYCIICVERAAIASFAWNVNGLIA